MPVDHSQHCPDCGAKMRRSEGTIVVFKCRSCGSKYSADQIEIIETHTPEDELPY